MTISYPSTFDDFTNPTASDKTNSVSVPHATQHANLNDAVESLEHRMGLSTSGLTGSSYPSTKIGDNLAVESTGGHTAWGTHHPVKIGSFVATSSAIASVDFTAIPQHFSGLLLQTKARGESTANAVNLGIQMGPSGSTSPDTAASYDFSSLFAIGATSSGTATLGSTRAVIAGIPGSTAPATLFGRSTLWIYDYASTDCRKTMVGQSWFTQSDTSQLQTSLLGGQWNSSQAIGVVRVFPIGSNFGNGSKVSLFGMP